MLFVVGDEKRVGKVLLVKADTQTDLDSRLKLEEGEIVLGTFTTAELNALQSSPFVVISS